MRLFKKKEKTFNYVVILDFTDAKVKYFKVTTNEEKSIEYYLYEKGFDLDNIEYMVVSKLEFEELE